MEGVARKFEPAIGGASLLQDAYVDKQDAYFDKPRLDYVHRLPRDASATILEIGCGSGATGELAIKEKRCARYVGVELFAPMAARARSVLSEVHEGNIETLHLPYAPATFDALILSEVLEHLADPQQTLDRLAVLLKPGGMVFASSPNISYWRVIRELIFGRFRYTETGIMDRTHLHWFTPESFRRLFEQAGFECTRLAPLRPMGRREKWLSRLFRGRFDHLTWIQIDYAGKYGGRGASPLGNGPRLPVAREIAG